MSLQEIILGLDPGSRHTGFGLIAVERDVCRHIEHGVIHLNSDLPLAQRLKRLHTELNGLFARHRVHTVVVEKIFFGKNADSAFKLGHARGVCLLSAAEHGAEFEEYAARFVKKCITGSGAAEKEQVQMMIFNLLRIPSHKMAFDASDALSLAVTHAQMSEGTRRMRKMMEGAP